MRQINNYLGQEFIPGIEHLAPTLLKIGKKIDLLPLNDFLSSSDEEPADPNYIVDDDFLELNKQQSSATGSPKLRNSLQNSMANLLKSRMSKLKSKAMPQMTTFGNALMQKASKLAIKTDLARGF
jgi:hypothetical protein